MKRLLLLFTCVVATMSLSPALSQQADKPRRIEIVASRYTYAPAEVTLTKGQPVTLVLTSKDVTHGLSVPEFGVKTEIPKGKETEITFTPDQAGTFEAQCANFCGPGHGEMKMTFRVEE